MEGLPKLGPGKRRCGSDRRGVQASSVVNATPSEKLRPGRREAPFVNCGVYSSLPSRRPHSTIDLNQLLGSLAHSQSLKIESMQVTSMSHTPTFRFIWASFVIAMISFCHTTKVVADLAVNWKLTINAEDFDLPSGYYPDGTRLKSGPKGAGGEQTWIESFWTIKSEEGLNWVLTFTIVDRTGNLLARKRASPGEKFRNLRWINDEFAVVEMNYGGALSHEVWKFDGNGGFTEKSFPFAGDVRGSNIKPVEANGPGVSGLFTVEGNPRSVTIRNLKWDSTNIAKASVKRKGANIEVSTETLVGKNYRVQSSEDLERWENNEQIIGDGKTQAVERSATKPKEFLRVIVE
jgi:hypothetical protein